MNVRSLVGIGLIFLLLAGCRGGGSSVREAGSVDRYIDLEGGRVVLHEPLRVSAGEARVFLQAGKVVGAANAYAPQCAFEIDRVDHQGVDIQPDTFRITGVEYVMEEIVRAESPLRVASLTLAGIDDGGGASQYFEGYHFWLASPRQPNVLRMTCLGVFADPGDLYAPTLQEIRATLGDIATIER